MIGYDIDMERMEIPFSFPAQREKKTVTPKLSECRLCEAHNLHSLRGLRAWMQAVWLGVRC